MKWWPLLPVLAQGAGRRGVDERNAPVVDAAAVLAEGAATGFLGTPPRAETYETCTITPGTSPCALAALTASVPTRITPPNDNDEGPTCIFGDEYSFDVLKGSPSRVMVYFEGGGACFDEYTTATNALCTTDVQSRAPYVAGIFDHTNPLNPFQNYTILTVSYCSGDAHLGNVSNVYRRVKREPHVVKATQKGYVNARAALSWLSEQQQQLGYLDPELSHVVVAGSSAGALGAQVWAFNVTSFLRVKEVSVIMDSYVGVFPEQTESSLFQAFGMCPFLPTAALRDECDAGAVLISDIVDAQIRDLLPSARFGFVQAKADNVQRLFYGAVATLDQYDKLLLTRGVAILENAPLGPLFYQASNSILELYNVTSSTTLTRLRPGGDVVTYFVDGECALYDLGACHAVYMDTDWGLYRTTTRGVNSTSMGSNGTLAAWYADFVPGPQNTMDGAAAEEDCDGPARHNDDDDLLNSTDWCDAALTDRSTTPFSAEV